MKQKYKKIRVLRYTDAQKKSVEKSINDLVIKNKIVVTEAKSVKEIKDISNYSRVIMSK